MTIQKITLSGTPEEIGYQHGQSLAEQIHHNIGFYRSLFLNTLGDQAQVLRAAAGFKESIRTCNPDYILEIDHIALGAQIPEPLWLYAINARTELSMMSGVHECTAVVCPEKGLLAQTWDWSQVLEGNFFLMEICFPDGHRILQLSEAGLIGKIGMNNQGLGVTLNYLYDEQVDLSTVPIHILMRRILESRSYDEAINAARQSGIGKASNLIVAAPGKATDIEFAGDRMHFHEIDGRTYAHTNHFLHAKPHKIVDPESYQNSLTRHATATRKLAGSLTCDLQKMIEVLSDQSEGARSILANYKPDPLGMLGDYGTLATIIMDLAKGTMLLRSGNPSNRDFCLDGFDEYRCSPV